MKKNKFFELIKQVLFRNIIVRCEKLVVKMSLNPLMKIVRSTLNSDPIEEIFWGSPTTETYDKVLANYNMLFSQMRREIIQKCMKKLSKTQETDVVIANLVLIQKLMKIDKLSLPDSQPQVLENSKKKQVTMAEKGFVRFYYTFLKRQQQQSTKNISLIDQAAAYCQYGLNKCLDIIKSKIIIQYCLIHSTNQATLRIALKQIFQDIKINLQLAISFITKNIHIIYEQSAQTSFAINEVYQTLLFVTKNIHKITVLIKKAGLAIAPLPIYQMDKELNLKIEMEMNARKNQKNKPTTQTQINNKNNLSLQEEYQPIQNTLPQSLSQIDQDQIFISQKNQHS